MKYVRMLAALSVLFLAACAAAPDREKSITASPELPEQYGHVSGMTFVTRNLDASVAFYRDMLGYVERRRVQMRSGASLAVFGIAPRDATTYVSMTPAEFTAENPNFPGLNFVETQSSLTNPFAADTGRKPVAGEIVLALNVVNLSDIERDMRAAGVQIVAPMAPSATGKSMVLTVLDPNGIRVQMYEYLKE